MNISVIGFGGMGKNVVSIAKERGHNIVSIIDQSVSEATHTQVTAEAIGNADVVIDFSSREAVLQNIELVGSLGINMIEGTTGWYDEMETVKNIVGKYSTGFLWSGNFSVGVNLYLKVVEYASHLFNNYPEYDIWGHEIHHAGKADSPSGTAKLLENILLDNLDRKTSVVEDKLDRKINSNEIHFSSTRGGQVNFAHTIAFDSAADTITLGHSARNRDGYALGAVLAAEWIQNKKGFYSMKDFLNIN